MRNVLRVLNTEAAQTALMLLAVAVLGGCTSTKPVATPLAGNTVEIEYAEPVALTMRTRRKKEAVHLPQVRAIEAKVLAVHGDSVDLRVLRTTPFDRRVQHATVTIARAPDNSTGSNWSVRQVSAGKTSLLLFSPFLILLLGAAMDPM